MDALNDKQRPGFSSRVILPLFVLLCGLGATALATYLVQDNLRVRNREDMLEGIHQIVLAIESRMEAYVGLLRGGAGAFAANEQVSRTQFRRFYDRLEIPTRYPGIQGFGYTLRFSAEQMDEVVGKAHAQGMTNFHVWPEQVRDEYHAIIYLEPEDERNQKAIGFDMYEQPVRRAAMEAARDTGNATLSGKVRLVQELEDQEWQAGFLIYVPIYFGGDVPETVEERRQKLQGYVYSPFRARNLFEAMLPENLVAGLAVAIWDGTNGVGTNLLFKTHQELEPRQAREVRVVTVAGRDWTVAFAPTSRFRNVAGTSLLMVVPIFGVLASLLLSGFARKEAGERVRAERAARALLKQREWLDVTLASIADAVITTDTFGRVEFMNAAAEQITGESMANARGRPIAEFFSIRDERTGNALANPAEKVLSTDEVVRFHRDVVLRTRSGAEKYIEPSGAPLRGRGHELLGVVLVFRETTERRMYEQKLAESEEIHRMIAETAADGVVVMDEQNRMLMVNSALERIFDYPAAELIGQPVNLLLVTGLHQSHVAGMRHFMASQDKMFSWSGAEIPGRRKDGEEIPLEVSFGAARRGSGFIFTGFLRDISERKRAEEEIRELNQELETRVERRTAALLESKEQMEAFTYSVAHDLRAPLRSMQGFAQALIEDCGEKLDAHGRDYLRRVMASAERMDSLIQDLLAYSQLSRSEVELSAVSLIDVANAAVAEHRNEAEKKGASLVNSVPDAYVEAHGLTLEHALSNLVSNALKFTVQGRQPRVEITAEDLGEVIRVCVRDNGIGIAPEYQERIFRVFERLHGPDAYPGTGIGLAIVKTGIERMGGRAGVQSTPGEGALFWVELRKVPADQLSTESV